MPTRVQLDFNLPERFNMFYINESNERARPIMIHRAIFGSIERFMGILVENYAGAFPLWLAPVQCRLLVVKDALLEHAEGLAARMRQAGLRVEVCGGASPRRVGGPAAARRGSQSVRKSDGPASVTLVAEVRWG